MGAMDWGGGPNSVKLAPFGQGSLSGSAWTNPNEIRTSGRGRRASARGTDDSQFEVTLEAATQVGDVKPNGRVAEENERNPSIHTTHFYIHYFYLIDYKEKLTFRDYLA